jgi:hypothetical protein
MTFAFINTLIFYNLIIYLIFTDISHVEQQQINKKVFFPLHMVKPILA